MLIENSSIPSRKCLSRLISSCVSQMSLWYFPTLDYEVEESKDISLIIFATASVVILGTQHTGHR